VGPDCRYGIEIYGTEGSVSWDFERLNELKVFSGRGASELGYVTVNANPTYGDFGRFQPGAGCSMGFDDLKAGRIYLQIHSERAPDGSIRGWLLK